MSYVRKTSDIHVSDRLQSILEQIKDESLVAKLLIKYRHPIETLVDNHVNYISVSEEDCTKISYLTPERFDVDDIWYSSKRFKIKPGGLIKKLFKDIPEKEVDRFSSLYRSVQNKPTMTFEVVSGEDIKKYYLYTNYESNCSSLGNSCMKYDRCQSFFDFYIENGVKMLIALNNNGKLLGRALLWETGDLKIMDRIYSIDDDQYLFYFKKWAKENGYTYKKYQNWRGALFFSNSDPEILKLEIPLAKSEFKSYPYLDTFKFLSLEKNKLYNYIPECDYIVLSSADGNFDKMNSFIFDPIDNFLYCYGDTTYVEYLDQRIAYNNLHYSEIYEKYILHKDSVYVGEIGDYIFKDASKNNISVINEKIEHYRNVYGRKIKFNVEELIEKYCNNEHTF